MDSINTTTNNNRLRHSYVTDDKYGANSKTALFIISGEKDNLGEVLCINNEVSELLGYEKSEIVAHNISKTMPPMIAAKHAQIMLNFFGSGKYTTTTDKLVLPLHKLGYIIPCAFLHRVVPNLARGLQLIGFLSKITDFSDFCPLLEKNMSPDDTVLLLADDSWMLQAFNIRASRLFGINPSQANLKKYISSEEKISLYKFIPELEDTSFVSQIRAPLGSETTLNLATIHKIIESEVEILRADQNQSGLVDSNGSSGSLGKNYEEVKDMSSPVTEGIVKGQLTCMDLLYGQYERDKEPEVKMKLIVTIVDQIIEKETVKANEVDTEIFKQRSKKYSLAC